MAEVNDQCIQTSPPISDDHYRLRKLHSPKEPPVVVPLSNNEQVNVYDVDPDLIVEVDIPFTDVGSPRPPRIEFRSTQSYHTERSSKAKLQNQGTSSASPIKTRGRPIKPHEVGLQVMMHI